MGGSLGSKDGARGDRSHPGGLCARQRIHLFFGRAIRGVDGRGRKGGSSGGSRCSDGEGAEEGGLF